MAAPAAGVIAAIGGIGWAAAQAASATEQAMGAVDTVFGSSADRVKQWSETSAQSVGLSQSAYAQMASVAGASLKSMGLSADDAATQTGDMIALSADLAATMGGTTADAVDALTSALRGEADPAERLGLKLNQTTVAAKMAADGTDKLTGTALEAAKAATIMQLAHDQAGDAIGKFAAESDTAAGSAQIASAQYENAKSTLGEGLLPILAAVTTALAGVAQWVGENSTLVLTLVGIVGGLAAAILAVNAAMALASAAQTVWTAAQTAGKAIMAVATAAQWAFNAAMAANPVMLVVLAIAALVAGLVILWNKSEGFRNFVIGMWEAIQHAAEAAWNFIKETAIAAWDAIKSVVTGYFQTIQGIIDGFKSFVVGVWNTIKDVGSSIWGFIQSAAQTALNIIMAPINAVKTAIDNVINGIKKAIDWAKNLASNIPVIGGLFKSSPAPAAAAAASRSMGTRFWVPGGTTPDLASRGLLGSAGPSPRAAGGGATVIVQGALDPVAVAKQIRALLLSQQRRGGAVMV
jgi:hypothetical protein